MLSLKHEHSKELALSSKPEDMQKMLALLSDQEKIIGTLGDKDEELFVEIVGTDDSLTGLALVKTPIFIEGNQVAQIGVFGPERMNYPAITQALKLVVEELKGGRDDKKERP